MRVPVIRGVIDRRILANYRCDPEVVSRLLPAPFRPQLVDGNAIAGVCLIRLKHVRPRHLPAALGIASENATHRIAVEWDDEQGRPQSGVYIPRRDTSSLLNALAGGRIFPGVHHRAHFDVRESDRQLAVAMTSQDGHTRVNIEAELSEQLPDGSVFASVEEVSSFFEAGSTGYSPCTRAGSFDGLELRTFAWQTTPLAVRHVESSFFDDESQFPRGSAVFDNALLMRGIEHEWHATATLCGTVE